jgi:glutamate carboxypeptidase
MIDMDRRAIQALQRYCDAEAAWVAAIVDELVRLESPSTDKAAVDRCGEALACMLASAGGQVEVLRQSVRGNHVRAQFDAPRRDRSDPGPVLLLGHFDTVWPVGQLERMPLRRDAGRLHGPGVFDMKAGIATALLAVRALRAVAADLAPDVVMLWTADEEIGSGTSRAMIEAEARRCRVVLVLEPSLPGGAVKTSRKGVGEYELTVRGVAAHAGVDPDKGASAIHELARQILAIEALQDLPRGVSLNVGVVRGGSRPNVIAEEARATIDVRVPTMADGARIEAALHRLRPERAGTSLVLTGGIDRPPFERSGAVAALYETGRDVARVLGRELSEGSTGGGSDGNFTAALGVPTLDGLGPAGDGAHALHEHVVESDLTWRAAFLAALLTQLRSPHPAPPDALK